jgi:hypothetical protein
MEERMKTVEQMITELCKKIDQDIETISIAPAEKKDPSKAYVCGVMPYGDTDPEEESCCIEFIDSEYGRTVYEAVKNFYNYYMEALNERKR